MLLNPYDSISDFIIKRYFWLYRVEGKPFFHKTADAESSWVLNESKSKSQIVKCDIEKEAVVML